MKMYSTANKIKSGKSILLLFCCFIYSSVYCQENTLLLSIEGFQEDIEHFHTTLKNTHILTNLYYSEIEFENDIKKIKDNINKETTINTFAFDLIKLVQKFGDSHTCINYNSLLTHSSNIEKQYLDIGIKQIGNRFYSTNKTDSVLPEFVEIISVNGIKISEIIKKTNTLSIKEGSEISRYNRVSEILYPMLLPYLVTTDSLNTVSYIDSNTRDTLFTEIIGKPLTKLNHKRKSSSQFGLSFHNNNNIAVLKIGSFSTLSSRKYHHLLKKNFKQIKKHQPQELIIDLRNNAGGITNRMEQLIAYINSDNKTMEGAILIKGSPLSKSFIDSKFSKFQRKLIQNYKGKNATILKAQRMFALPNEATDTIHYKFEHLVKNKFVYKGNKTLLVNGKTGSSAANMTNYFHALSLGKVAGENPLGSKECTWGNASPFTLPNSGLEFYVSTIKILPPTGSGTSNILDICLVENIEEIRQKKDSMLQQLLTLIQSEK